MGKTLSLMLAAFITTAISGCGTRTPMAHVHGKITIDGRPYGNGDKSYLVFMDADSGAGANAEINTDGTFQLDKAIPLGNYAAFLAIKMEEDAYAPPPPDPVVPPKYFSGLETDQLFNVVEGENNIAIEMTH